MPDNDLLRLSAQIVAAHVRHNSIDATALPDFIRSVYEALDLVGVPPAAAETLKPAVPIKKSVFPGYIVCLEDGRKLKMLKRHLLSAYNMTPDEYRIKWGLPDTYPMVAPDYAARRSVLAKENGLGRVPAPPAVEVTVQKIQAGVRGKKPGPKKTPAPALETETASEANE